jgi:hypothetical protein
VATIQTLRLIVSLLWNSPQLFSYIICQEPSKYSLLISRHIYFPMQLLFGFYDHGCHQDYPGWALRNYIAFLSLRWKIEKVQFLCYRERRRGVFDLANSLIGEASFAEPHGIMIFLDKTFTISLVIRFF